MEKRVNKRKISIILSLILHLFLLLFFIFRAFKTTHKFIIVKPAKPLTQKEKLARQAALFPKKSDGGTKVVFDDSLILPPPPEKKEVKPTHNYEEKIIEKKEAIKNIATVKKAPFAIQKPIEDKIIKKQPLVKQQEKKETAIVDPIDFKENIRKTLTKQKMPEIEKIVTKEEKSKKIAKDQPIKKPRKSLLALTKTFLDHPQGNSSMHRYGENKFPSLEEMKYICYEKQIHDHIVATWRTLYAGVIQPTAGTTRFTFLINEKGGLDEVQLIESSGNSEFDLMVLNAVKKAAPFPEIPKHFGVRKYRPRGGLIHVPL